MTGDPLAPARGILAAVAVGVAIWIVVYLAVFA